MLIVPFFETFCGFAYFQNTEKGRDVLYFCVDDILSLLIYSAV